MAAAISLRADLDAEGLRRLARQSKHSVQARRLLVPAAIYDGGSRSDAAQLGYVTLQIARECFADNAHAVLVMDQAGWHISNNLVIPGNISILPLPPKSPELSPVEKLWLSNRVFKS